MQREKRLPVIDALKRIEEALDPYAPYTLIAMFLWLLGGCLYQALSRAANSPAWKAGSGGAWAFCKHVSGPVVEWLQGELRGVGDRGQVWEEVARNGSRGSAGRSQTQPPPRLVADVPTGRRHRNGTRELRIVICAKSREGRAWTAKVLEVQEQTGDRVVVRDTKPPWVKSAGGDPERKNAAVGPFEKRRPQTACVGRSGEDQG